MNIYVLDSDRSRNHQYVNEGSQFKHVESVEELAIPNEGPCIVLIHASDTGLKRWADEVTREAEARVAYETALRALQQKWCAIPHPMAFLYISGALDGAAHLRYAVCGSGERDRHHHAVSEQVDGSTIIGFVERVKQLSSSWESRLERDRSAAPEWSILDDDWLRDAVECLCSLQCGAPIAEGVTRWPLKESVVAAQARRLLGAPTADEAAMLKMLDRAAVCPSNLGLGSEAIRVLVKWARDQREAVGR